MVLKKTLPIAITIQEMFISTTYTIVSCRFFSGRACIVECDGKSKEFKNLTELSNGINK